MLYHMTSQGEKQQFDSIILVVIVTAIYTIHYAGITNQDFGQCNLFLVISQKQQYLQEC